MHDELSPFQTGVVDALSTRGFSINRVTLFSGENFPTVFMSKRVNRHSTHYAEVDGEGLVNGVPLDKFTLG